MIESLAAQNDRIGTARAMFDGIRLDYPPQTAAQAALERLRTSTRQRAPGQPCGGVMLVSPHGTGKTVGAKQTAEYALRSSIDDSIPVLRVESATSGNTDALPTSILSALGHRRPDVGNEKVRWIRAIAELSRRAVELVIFDEFNRASRKPTMSRPIASSIRERIMDSGVAAVAFVGTEEAAVVLDQCPELVERLDADIDLRPMDWLVADDRTIFVQLVADLDDEMVRLGLLAERCGLAGDDIAGRLCEASSGRIRRIMGIVRRAMEFALERRASAIDVADLCYATDQIAVQRGYIERNPFV